MYHYELTERGKIVIAVVLVLLLLLLPSVVLLCTTMAHQPLQPSEHEGPGAYESPHPTVVVTPPQVITVSPPPTSNGTSEPNDTPPGIDGTDPPDVSPPSVDATDPPDVSPPGIDATSPPDVSPPINGGDPGGHDLEPSEPPKIGPTGGNPSEGTLSFLFYPHLQNSLDVETSALLDEFIASPKNTKTNLISIELPQLSGDDAEKALTAITSAFIARGIPEQRLSFSSQPQAAVNGVYQIRLSFIPNNIK